MIFIYSQEETSAWVTYPEVTIADYQVLSFYVLLYFNTECCITQRMLVTFVHY